MAKLTYDQALEALGDERPIKPDDVTAAALRRTVWVAEWHYPGCLCEAFNVCRTKSEAIETALLLAETEDGPPRGMKTALRDSGWFETTAYGARAINRVYRDKLANVIN